MSKEFNNIIVRQRRSDFRAHQLADRMQSIDGVEVVCVTCQDDEHWHVYAKYNDQVIGPNEIDSVTEEKVEGDG